MRPWSQRLRQGESEQAVGWGLSYRPDCSGGGLVGGARRALQTQMPTGQGWRCESVRQAGAKKNESFLSASLEGVRAQKVISLF